MKGQKFWLLGDETIWRTGAFEDISDSPVCGRPQGLPDFAFNAANSLRPRPNLALVPPRCAIPLNFCGWKDRKERRKRPQADLSSHG